MWDVERQTGPLAILLPAPLATGRRATTQHRILIEGTAEFLPRETESRDNRPQHLKTRIPFSALDARVIRPVDIRDFGEPLLR